MSEQKIFFKVGLLLSLPLFLSGCMYFTSNIYKAKRALKAGDCTKAKKFFHLSQNKSPDFAEKAAAFCLAKSPKKSVWFYTYLFEREEDRQKRQIFKEKVATIYFEKLKDYEKAIEAYSDLKNYALTLDNKKKYIFYIALSYFEMGKWTSSLKELDILKTEDLTKETLFLKARIFLMQEQLDLAEKTFREIQKRQPQYFKETRMFLYLSFIYESRKQFDEAISELKNFSSTGDFLENKIKLLERRQRNQPGEILK